MIYRDKDGWCVKSESGKKLGGPYSTKAEAEKRLRQVEYYKHYTDHKEKSEKGHGKKHEAAETKAQEKTEHKK